MKLKIPNLSLVLLIGPSGSGKSTFARKHFLPTEVVSSDTCRGLVSDDENNQTITPHAFALLHFMVRKRLELGRLTVVDATNVQPEARAALVELAREFHMLPTAIVFKIPEEECQVRNKLRPDRNFGSHVIRNQCKDLYRSMRNLRREGFRHIHVLNSVAEVDAAEIVRDPLYNDLRHETGPFDIIGDVHGCYDELCDLLKELGYAFTATGVVPPEGRKAVFVGDLVDRGPASPQVLRLVMDMVREGSALAVPGNHDIKLMRKLKGADVKVSHGLQETLDQLAGESVEFTSEVLHFLDSLVSHYVLDGGELVVAHAGMKESMQGRGSSAVREFALFGETTGETDEYGLPVRVKWAEDYRGRAMVVYGHTPVIEAEWLNRTICIDTGCVFGGKLTALRYPERELVSVMARAVYAEPVRPLQPPSMLSLQQLSDDQLDIADVRGRQHIHCESFGHIVIPQENGSAALEVMGRFAADPRWLAYLPPTMSPSETSTREGFLEHPEEAFAYFAGQGIAQVVCEEKHMGSRTVIALGRDAEACARRFGVTGALGRVMTRSGRPFFDDLATEQALLERLAAAMDRSGFWQELATDWAILDCELMPWSAKAQGLLKSQFAPLGAAAGANLPVVADWLDQATKRLDDLELVAQRERMRARADAATRYVDAYRRYCWPVNSLEDYKIAPFHIMATEGAVHVDRPHSWHMTTLAAACAEDPGVLRITPWLTLDPTSPEDVARGTEWWLEHVGRGGEGMVIKPMDFLVKNTKGTVQPALKCRGPEYLRIIYGPEYLFPENLERLRKRGLNRKRSLALREFALGIEGLRRFVRREPLRRVHQCVFGVLALESEPVDPRL